MPINRTMICWSLQEGCLRLHNHRLIAKHWTKVSWKDCGWFGVKWMQFASSPLSLVPRGTVGSCWLKSGLNFQESKRSVFSEFTKKWCHMIIWCWWSVWEWWLHGPRDSYPMQIPYFRTSCFRIILYAVSYFYDDDDKADEDDDDKKVGFSRLPSPPPVRLVGGQKLIGKWSQFSLLPYLAMIIIHLCLASSIIIFISIQHHLPE